MNNVSNVIHNSIKNLNNIIINNSTHIILDSDSNNIQYDAPTQNNFTIFNNKSNASDIKKTTTNINLEPTYIKYIISRDNYEQANRSSNIEHTPLYNNIQEMLHKYQSFEQSLLLYNKNNVNNIQGIIPQLQKKFNIDKSDLTSEKLHTQILEMKNYMITNSYIHDAVWIVSNSIYQLIQGIMFEVSTTGEWKNKLYGLPIYICNDMEVSDVLMLVNLKESYCVLTKPSYNLVNIDTNTLRNNDGYEIDITIYIGSHILNNKAGCILQTT